MPTHAPSPGSARPLQAVPAGPSPPGVRPPRLQVTRRVRTYEVEGATAGELDLGIQERGPRWEGQAWAGMTHAPVRWEYRTVRRGETCWVSGLRIRVEAEVVLPRWSPPPGAPARLVREWEAFRGALEHHEEGHVEVARRTAEALRDSVAALPGLPCREVVQRVDALGARVLAGHGPANREYDQRTGHGLAQGARRPRDPAPGEALVEWLGGRGPEAPLLPPAALVLIGLLLVALWRAGRR